jgi:hypothetical protein
LRMSAASSSVSTRGLGGVRSWEDQP